MKFRTTGFYSYLKKEFCQRFVLRNGLFFCLFLLCMSAYSQTFPSGFSQTAVATGLNAPTVLAFAPDGRIFIAEQGGKVRILKNGTLLATPFIQLTVDSFFERGLIGMAFDPGFATNQYIYLYYTVSTGTKRNRISRFKASGDVAVAGSETVILELDPLNAGNHNGGAMKFGPDGKLYVGVGENAVGSNAQNLDNHLGKLLRINTDGTPAAGNPFASGSLARQRIWAYGLRNPYTFDIQPGTGRIFVNDVGQNAWEEIDDATIGGKNFGWPQAEGNSTNPAYTNPVFAYPHGTGDGKGCGITGGTFFNPASSSYPASYTGKYFYQDLCNNWINVLDISGSTAVRAPFATNLPGQSLSLTAGPDGNLYYISRTNGALYKIIYTTNTAPVITSQPLSQTVAQGEPVTFSVTATGTAPLSYQWQKDGVNIAGATNADYTTANTTTASAGSYRVRVSNTAGSVFSQAATLTITAANTPPIARITSPANHTLYRGGSVISFAGTGTDAEDGTLPASAFSWSVVFHHNTHVHDGPPIASGVRNGTFTIPNQGETASDVWYRLFLTVTDSQGRSSKDSIDLDPRLVMVRVETVPTGLQVILDERTRSTPYTQPFVAGMQVSIGAPSPQTLNGASYVFSNWSPAITGNTFIVPDTNTTYTATYQASTGSTTTYLSDLTWTSVSNGWGPVEKDKSNGEQAANDGRTLTLNGVTYAKGLGVHAISSVVYALNGQYSRFISDVGLDDEVGSNGSVNFRVFLDNVEVYASGLMRGNTATKTINLDVTGKTTLRLAVNAGGDGNSADHADWAGARLVRSATAQTLAAPQTEETVSVTISPNPAADQVAVSWECAESQAVTLLLSNPLVGCVRTHRQVATTGKNTFHFYTGDLPKGVYFLSIEQGNQRTTKKILIVR